jgi:hypothetical protein
MVVSLREPDFFSTRTTPTLYNKTSRTPLVLTEGSGCILIEYFASHIRKVVTATSLHCVYNHSLSEISECCSQDINEFLPSSIYLVLRPDL